MACVTLLAVAWAAPSVLRLVVAPPGGSCATFVMRSGDAPLVGHNLDEAIEVPGVVVANPRGVAKENVSWNDIKAVFGRSKSEPRRAWVSRYGSLTYNAMALQFPDGGLNEAGLYVGEMTLLGTKYPDAKLPRFYHNNWIQYLLDNFATVDEALASLGSALPDGHCQWHFLVADRSGGVAVVEFLKGKSVIYKGPSLPYPVLCNDAYAPELDDIKNYAGFGGAKDPEPRYPREDPRFRWAAVMLRAPVPERPPVDHAFAILGRLDINKTTKWSLVCDLNAMRMYFRTYRAGAVRWVDFKALDLACAAGTRLLDIHRDLAGDVSARLAPATDADAVRIPREFWSGADMGVAGNLFLRPKLVARMPEAQRALRCAE